MKNKIKRTLPCIATGGAAMLLFGCKTIVRENIVASIDTGLGATLAENKETQLYELKAGYIHSQFYSIPTGKIVDNDSTNNAMVTSTNGKVTNAQVSNAANITPQMVSGIKASTSLADVVVGMNIAENFAVGDVAVNSKAATAMYIADAANPATAQAAAGAVSATNQVNTLMTAVNDRTNAPLRTQLDQLIAKPLDKTKAKNPDGTQFQGTTSDYANYLSGQIESGSTWADIRTYGGANLQKLIQQLQQVE